jgi:Na+/H+-dicarboxylate symporter
VKLHNKLLIALLAGIALGALLHPYADAPWLVTVSTHILRPIGQIFLRSIFMIVVPMVFSALVIGVYELGRGHDLSGVAGRTLAFTLLLSAASVLVGMGLVNILRPGAGLELAGGALPGAAMPRPPARSATSLSSSCPATRSTPPSGRWTAKCCRSWCSR